MFTNSFLRRRTETQIQTYIPRTSYDYANGDHFENKICESLVDFTIPQLRNDSNVLSSKLTKTRTNDYLHTCRLKSDIEPR